MIQKYTLSFLFDLQLGYWFNNTPSEKIFTPGRRTERDCAASIPIAQSTLQGHQEKLWAFRALVGGGKVQFHCYTFPSS